METVLGYPVRRSSRARRSRILVSGDGVEVVMPDGQAVGEIEQFVAGRRGWIDRTLHRIREAEAERPPAALVDGGHVICLGDRLDLRVVVEPQRRRAHVSRRGSRLTVKVGRGGDGPVRDAVEAWYRRRARDEIGWRLDAAAARAGVRYTGLQIRSQQTRWASCSATGAMSFNWRLLLAPAEVLDYVVEHEVCHLTVHDHSDRFWALLERRMPDYRRHQRWLRRYGPSLRLG